MQALAHVYTKFIPVAIALLLAAVLLSASGDAAALRRQFAAVAILWLVSATVVVASLVATGAGSVANSFIAQRDIGYWLGSALGLAIPFVACMAIAYLARGLAISRLTRLVGLALAASLLFLAVPQFFAVGWVAGCAFLGYKSCM